MLKNVMLHWVFHIFLFVFILHSCWPLKKDLLLMTFLITVFLRIDIQNLCTALMENQNNWLTYFNSKLALNREFLKNNFKEILKIFVVMATLTGEAYIWGPFVNDRGEVFTFLLNFSYLLAPTRVYKCSDTFSFMTCFSSLKNNGITLWIFLGPRCIISFSQFN